MQWCLPIVELACDIVRNTVRTGLARCKVTFDLLSSTKVTEVIIKESKSLTRFSYKPYLLTLITQGGYLPGSSDP